MMKNVLSKRDVPALASKLTQKQAWSLVEVTANSLHPTGFAQEDEISPWMYHTQILCAAFEN